VTWHDVAHKNVHDASRSRTVWLVSGVLALLFVGYALAHGFLGETTFGGFVDGLMGIVATFLPALGILLGYRSISDDREDGSLLLALAFPHSRRDLVVGTALGRAAVLVVPTLVTLTLAAVVGAIQYGTDGVLRYPWFVFATCLYGTAFVGVGVGLSMATTSDRRITFGAVGGYLLLSTLWSGLVSFAIGVLHRFDPSIGMPDWGLLLQLAGPREAFVRLVRAGFEVDGATRYVGEGVPAYVDWWAAALLLVAWVAVPIALGFRTFSTSDL
jgi:ABC-2 type transport system permease protein